MRGELQVAQWSVGHADDCLIIGDCNAEPWEALAAQLVSMGGFYPGSGELCEGTPPTHGQRCPDYALTRGEVFTESRAQGVGLADHECIEYDVETHARPHPG